MSDRDELAARSCTETSSHSAPRGRRARRGEHDRGALLALALGGRACRVLPRRTRGPWSRGSPLLAATWTSLVPSRLTGLRSSDSRGMLLSVVALVIQLIRLAQ